MKYNFTTFLLIMYLLHTNNLLAAVQTYKLSCLATNKNTSTINCPTSLSLSEAKQSHDQGDRQHSGYTFPKFFVNHGFGLQKATSSEWRYKMMIILVEYIIPCVCPNDSARVIYYQCGENETSGQWNPVDISKNTYANFTIIFWHI